MATEPKQPESVETPPAPQAEPKTPVEAPVEPAKPEESQPLPQEPKPTEEEAAWETLPGSTQERVKTLLHRAKQAEEAAQRLQQAQADYQQLPQGNQPVADDSESTIQEAIRKLRERGVATTDDLQLVLGKMRMEQHHGSLESKYDGSKGPKYDREEVEDFMHQRGIANPEDAFKLMYYDELADLERSQQKRKYFTEKPTAPSSVQEEPVSVESLRSKLRNPDGSLNLEWWDKNRGNIEKLLPRLTAEG